MEIEIHYTRLHGKPLTIYHETLLAEDALRLKTEGLVSPDERLAFSELWWKAGLIPPGRQIARLVKHYFFDEWFDVLQIQTEAGEVLGYYSDICTPLVRTGLGLYATTDLCLDLWLGADGVVKELDWDEFEHTAQQNLMTPPQQAQAKQALARLVAETAQGTYPRNYIT